MPVTLLLVAGYAMSAEPSDDEKRDLVDLPDNVERVFKEMDLSDDERQELASTFGTVVGTMQLIQGHQDEEMARFVEQEFLGSDETERWACDDASRFIRNRGCGEDGCPVKLAANYSMNLGTVFFAGVESYAYYEVQGLERKWRWGSHDDDEMFRWLFAHDAGGDGLYYDFDAPSTSTNSDGIEIARPAGRFKCERFVQSD